ncbi:CMRF35-like molecule 2 [Protopterus annectens]|uniref:CMRF35-like molecule 2 n=1 Tax=Protopterus annectens TaxID=7888 RepID=UPI001CFAD489|nr:CMRF35-like molecule 2 [Protopterus annectens]
MRLIIVLEVLFISASSSLEGPGEVSGSVGTSVTITCKYNDNNNNKYWCKGYYRVSCDVLIQTNGSEVVVHRDRMSISDNQTIQEFTITLQNLTIDDAGWYWCGVNTVSQEVMHSVKLTITEEPPKTMSYITPESLTAEHTSACLNNCKVTTEQSVSDRASLRESDRNFMFLADKLDTRPKQNSKVL